MYQTTSFPLTVNHTAVESLLTAGNYDLSNNDINSENFPEVKDGETKTEAFLVYLLDEEVESFIWTFEAKARLDKMGLRPAGIDELLAFGAQYPEIQRQFTVVALGSELRIDNYPHNPVLSHIDNKRIASFSVFGTWTDHHRFLAFRKSPEA